MSLQAGNRLGSYEVLSPLGAGGMGEAYKAKDTPLERTIALQVSPGASLEGEERRERFEREEKLLARTNLPRNVR